VVQPRAPIIAGLLVSSIVAAALRAQGDVAPQASPATALRPAGAETETFVRQALEDRLAAGDLPDIGLLGQSKHIAIRRELPKAGLTLGPGALPKRDGYEFELISAAEARSEATRTKRTISFVAIDEPVITGETATIWLGADLAWPDDPNVVKLCCCEGKARFSRARDRWAFVRWDTMECS
jgi:hypothetical protein